MLFVDEIHRLPRALEETFYPAMEDHRLPITVGRVPARGRQLPLPPFTLIGATTRSGLMTTRCATALGSGAARLYTTRSSRRSSARRADPRGGARGGRRARDRAAQPRHPRVANRLLKRARDYAEVRGDGP